MKTRVCTRCGNEYPLTREFFNVKKDNKEGFHTGCKECEKKRVAKYYNENRDACIKKMKEAYRKKNPRRIVLTKEEKSERKRQYYLKNKERIKESRKKYLEANKEKYKIWYKQYYLKNREKIIAYSIEYGRSHREYSRVAWENRRARKKNAEGRYTSNDVKNKLKQQREKCWWCGEKIISKKYDIDHVVPLSRGGTNYPNNIVISCPSCNRSKGSKLPCEFIGRLF